MTRITVWDGAHCVGGNKILLQDEGLTLWLDFGQNLNRLMEYYEEYLKPQKARGLYELLVMELLPPVQGIYHARFLEDYGFEQWRDTLDEVHGVLLSHAHLDHAGDLQYLREEVPLFCSRESALLLRALQDVGNDDGTIYVRRFELKDGEWQKVAWNRKGETASFRPVRCADEDGVDENAQEFWTRLPEGRETKCTVRPLEPFGGVLNGHPVRFFPIDHSIPGAGAWAVETSAGWVVYTGDIRFRGERKRLTERFLQEAEKLKPVALVIEGTRIGKSGSGYTEHAVQEGVLELLRRSAGKLVVANFSMTHLERLERFWQSAREVGRRLVVNPKDLYLLHAWHKSGRALDLQDGSLCLYQGVGKPPSEAWEKHLHTHYGGLCITAKELARRPGDYLLCFGYFDLNELPYIGVAEGVWLQSFSEPLSEEQRIDDARLNRWLKRFGFVRYPNQGSADEETVPLHVSGHASGEELQRVVESIRPSKLIPVHTTEPDKFQQMFSGLCEVIIPQQGEGIEL